MQFFDHLNNEIGRILSTIGIILAIITFPYLNKKNKSNLFLSFFFLISGFYALLHYNIFNHGNKYVVATIFGLIAPLMYLLRPLAYWYVRSMINNRIFFTKWDYLLLLPCLFHFIDILPYLFSPFSHKLVLAELIIQDFNNVFLHPIGNFLSPAFHFIFRPIFSITILLFEVKMLFTYFKKHPIQKSKYPTMHKWLWIFTSLNFILTFVLGFASIIIKINSPQNLYENSYLLFLLNLANFSFLGLLISVFLFPQILYGIAIEQEIIINNNEKTEENIPTEVFNEKINIEKEEENKSLFKLETSRLIEIETLIQTYFVEEKPYLDESFTINKLSDGLSIPIHHLSYFFNFYLEKKFSDFKNEWRINYAIELLKSGILKKYTIEQLYKEAGFSTKSNFYRVFRIHTGKTPIEYIEDINKSS